MKAFLDFEDKSVEKAVQKACAELNIPSDKLKYDIISYGSSGIFGLVGVKKALIRVSLPEPAQHQLKSRRMEKKTKDKKDASPATDDESHRNTASALVDDAFGETAADEPANEEEPVPPEPANMEMGIRVASEFLQNIIDILSVNVGITAKTDSKDAHICVEGIDSGFLIGKKGQTLEAIQYLIDKVVGKHCGRGTQIIVDVEGYLESRNNELKELAKRLADKVQKSGKPHTISRMNAQERRIVHIVLKNNKAVRTQSVGDGYYRKLIIFPKKKASKTKAKNTFSAE